jgi:hypothetical protein
MRRLVQTALAAAIGVGMLFASPDTAAAQLRVTPRPDRFGPPDTATLQPTAPDRKYSMPVPLPDFLPGLGALNVDPTTLPAGPFLAYDHDGSLVSSIYMIPLKDLNTQKSFIDLQVAQRRVDHVDIVFNAGHPAVAGPHYHMIVWYVSPQHAAELAQVAELTK